MNSSKLVNLIAALAFVALAAAALYRLLVGFELKIGGAEVGQTSTFFVFVGAAAMSLIFLRGLGRSDK
jgi:hypothetical protein